MLSNFGTVANYIFRVSFSIQFSFSKSVLGTISLYVLDVYID